MNYEDLSPNASYLMRNLTGDFRKSAAPYPMPNQQMGMPNMPQQPPLPVSSGTVPVPSPTENVLPTVQPVQPKTNAGQVGVPHNVANRTGQAWNAYKAQQPQQPQGMQGTMNARPNTVTRQPSPAGIAGARG